MYPPIDEDEAQKFVGKTLLIGVTYINQKGEFLRRWQWHGVITKVSNERGIVVALNNDPRHCALPPILSAIKPAEPGEYRLRCTGETVVDPHYLTTWIDKAEDPEEGAQTPSGPDERHWTK